MADIIVLADVRKARDWDRRNLDVRMTIYLAKLWLTEPDKPPKE
jgi:hypothetical protein